MSVAHRRPRTIGVSGNPLANAPGQSRAAHRNSGRTWPSSPASVRVGVHGDHIPAGDRPGEDAEAISFGPFGPADEAGREGMAGEARIATGGFHRLSSADRIRQVDFQTSRNRFGHHLVPVEESDSALASSADKEATADRGRVTQGHLRRPAEDPGEQAAHVAAVRRVGRPAVPCVDDDVPLGHGYLPGQPTGSRRSSRPGAGGRCDRLQTRPRLSSVELETDYAKQLKASTSPTKCWGRGLFDLVDAHGWLSNPEYVSEGGSEPPRAAVQRPGR